MKVGYFLRSCLLFAAVATCLPTFSLPAKASAGEEKTNSLSERYGRIPLFFVKNEGQMDSKVRFHESSGGRETFFTDEGVTFALTRPDESPAPGASALSDEGPGLPLRSSHLIKLTPLGMKHPATISAEEAQSGKTNFFIGDDPIRWHTDIPTYRSLVYKDVYPGVDFKFYGNHKHLEYDIVVEPGADLSRVSLQYSGIEGLEIADGGDLAIQVAPGLALTQRRPLVYQVIDGVRVERTGKFFIKRETYGSKPSMEQFAAGPGALEHFPAHSATTSGEDHVFGFEVASYDRRYPLVIDPILIYSGYLGGTGSDFGYALAVDSSGQVTLTGHTLSHDFPTKEPFHGPYGGANAKVFVTKLNAEGDALVYSTYLGGKGHDFGYGVALDTAGNAYVAGYTDSTNFPKKNAYQKAGAGGWDAFVTKLGPGGNTLVYSTYLGGTGDEGASAIAVDSGGNAYLTGRTASRNFPLAFPFQSAFAGGESDAFVAKLNDTGKGLIYSTYLGGRRPGWWFRDCRGCLGECLCSGNNPLHQLPSGKSLSECETGFSGRLPAETQPGRRCAGLFDLSRRNRSRRRKRNCR